MRLEKCDLFEEVTQTRPARAIASMLTYQNSWFGDQIATRSPFTRPKLRKPAASLSALNKTLFLTSKKYNYFFITLRRVSAKVNRVFSLQDTIASLSGCFKAVALRTCPTFMYLNGSEPIR